MKKYGGFIPGICAGRLMAEYLDYVLNRTTLLVRCVRHPWYYRPAPRLIAFALVGADQNFPFGGASILIIVGVGLETVKQIDAQLQQRHYEGLHPRIPTSARFLIVGPQGSGSKGTQGVLVAEAFGVPQVATGDIFLRQRQGRRGTTSSITASSASPRPARNASRSSTWPRLRG